MIYEKYDENLFISRFKDYDRVGTEDEGKNFTYKGLRHLFKWLDESYEGEMFKLDVVSICCDFTEYKNLNEYLKYEDNEEFKRKDDETEEAFKSRIEDLILEKYTLIKFDDDLDEGFLIQIEYLS